MAQEQVVGLRIQLNGMNTVIQDIQTFEQLLKEAREDLNQIPIDSENFKVLREEIKKAEEALGKLKNAGAQGQKEFGDFQRKASVLTQTFAGATAALTLFGNETEQVGQIQRSVGQIITAVITAQAIAQAELGGATIATTIALRAEAAAAATTSTALKALFTTIAANPVGAILVVLGLLAAALSTIGDETEETTEVTKSYTQALLEARTAAASTEVKLKTYVQVVNDVNESEATRQQAYKELKKILPELENLTLKQAQANGVLNDAIERELTLIKLRAEYKALEEIYIQDKKKEYEEEKKKQDGLRITIALEAERVRGLALQRGATKQEADQAYELYKQQQSYRLSALSAEDQLINKGKEILNLEGQRTQVIVDNTTAGKENNDVLQERLQLQLESLKLQELINQGSYDYESDAFKRLQELDKKYQDWFNRRAERFKTDGDKFREGLKELVPDLEAVKAELPGADPAQLIFDFILGSDAAYGRIFDEKGKAIKLNAENLTKLLKDQLQTAKTNLDKYVINQNDPNKYALYNLLVPSNKTEADFVMKQRFYVDNITRLFDEQGNLIDDLTNEQVKSVAQYFGKIQQAVESYGQKQIKIGDITIPGLDPEKAPEQINTFLGKVYGVLNDPTILEGFKELEIGKLVDELFKFDPKTLSDFKGSVEQQKIQLDAYNKAVSIIRENFTKFGVSQIDYFTKSKEDAEEYTKTLEKVGMNMESLVVPLMRARQSGDLKTLVAELDQQAILLTNILTGVSKEITGNITLVDVFFEDVLKREDDYIRQFGVNAKQVASISVGVISEQFGDLSKLTLEQLTELQAELLTSQILFGQKYGEEGAKIFEDYLKRVTEALNKATKAADKSAEELIKSITFGLQQLQATLGNLSQTFSESFGLQMEMLEYDYEKNMEGIVGETKQANKKRLELEKNYQAEKKRIEKEARLASLKIQFAETVATGAQAVVQAIVAAKGNPVLAAVFGSINAIITASQLAIIAQQIQFVSQMRRGGRLAGGGIATGPSHENGGIYAGGGTYLEGNEAVVNRQSTIKYSSLLSNINQAEGGRPILVGNSMDTRLIEVLAKQRQEPIRAYVIEQDISRAQSINRKLEQLASF